MTALYIISKYLTFPGAYLRCFWEQIMCRMCGCGIESDGYMRFDEACGHVDHDFPKGKAKAVCVAMIPGIMNFIFGAVFALSGILPLFILGLDFSASKVMFCIYCVSLYVGVSMLCNIFPLVDDALLCWERVMHPEKGAGIISKILLFIPSAVMIAGAYVEKYCISFVIWAAAVAAAFIAL